MENVELKGGYISFSRPGTYAYQDTVSKSNIGAQSPLPSVLFSVTITLREKGGREKAYRILLRTYSADLGRPTDLS